MNKLISVIMPCHNGGRFLDQAIHSVLRQSHDELELMIVDNNSTDDSRETIRKSAALDSRVVPLECTTRGAAHARNSGIRHASGRYIAFLDCDDWWEPEKLLIQIEAMQKAKAAMCWSSYRVVDSAGQFRRNQVAAPTTDYEAHMTKRNVIGCLTVVYDTALVGKLFMPEIRMRQDYGLWATIIRKATELNVPLIGLPQVLATYRVHDAAMTRNKFRAAQHQWELYRRIEGHSPTRSLYYFWHYLINALRNRN